MKKSEKIRLDNADPPFYDYQIDIPKDSAPIESSGSHYHTESAKTPRESIIENLGKLESIISEDNSGYIDYYVAVFIKQLHKENFDNDLALPFVLPIIPFELNYNELLSFLKIRGQQDFDLDPIDPSKIDPQLEQSINYKGENYLAYQGLLNPSGKFEGKGKLYHKKSGTLMYEGNFVDGRIDQKMAVFRTEEHDFKVTTNYENGEAHGFTYIFNRNIILFKGDLLNGKLNGLCTFYYENGAEKFKGFFEKGLLRGNIVLKTPEHSILAEIYFANGVPNGHGTIYNYEVMTKESLPTKKKLFGRRNMHKTGTSKTHKNILLKCNWKNGYPDGKCDIMYPNGDIWFHGKLDKGIREGEGIVKYPKEIKNRYCQEFLKI